MNHKKTAIACTLLATALFGCEPEETNVVGSQADFNGTKVTTWATLDAKGTISKVGFTLPYAAVEHAHTGSDGTHAPEIIVTDFPAQVASQTLLDHLEFDWMPDGHDPARYMAPHFDFHFYIVDKASVAAVDCKNPKQPDPATVAEGWVPPVPPDLADPTVACIPHMGYHALPNTEFTSSGTMKDGTFDKVMIAGYYDGAFTFIEPMITKPVMEQKAGFTMAVPQPKMSGKNKLYPTTLDVTYDASASEYKFTLSGFKPLP